MDLDVSRAPRAPYAPGVAYEIATRINRSQTELEVASRYPHSRSHRSLPVSSATPSWPRTCVDARARCIRWAWCPGDRRPRHAELSSAWSPSRHDIGGHRRRTQLPLAPRAPRTNDKRHGACVTIAWSKTLESSPSRRGLLRGFRPRITRASRLAPAAVEGGARETRSALTVLASAWCAVTRAMRAARPGRSLLLLRGRHRPPHPHRRARWAY